MHLDRRPQLTGYVEAALPSELFVDTSANQVSFTTPWQDSKPLASANKKRSSNDLGEIAEAIKLFGKNDANSPMNQAKMEFYGSKTKRRAKEEARKEREEERKEQELACHFHVEDFKEWERVQASIFMLQGHLNNITESFMKESILEDIKGLINRKNELAKKLNLK